MFRFNTTFINSFFHSKFSCFKNINFINNFFTWNTNSNTNSIIHNIDGNITNNVYVYTNLNNKVPGTYKVIYEIKDSSGNKTNQQRTIIVKKKEVPKQYTSTKTTNEEINNKINEINKKLSKGLAITKTDGKAYKASNIKVAENFRNELQSGNYLYNIVHLVPAVVKVPVQFLTKVSGKIRYNKNALILPLRD